MTPTDLGTVELWVVVWGFLGTGKYQLLTNSAVVRFEVRSDGKVYLAGVAKAASVEKKWQHIALVLSSTDSLYIDGELLGQCVHASAAGYQLKLEAVTASFRQLRVWNVQLTAGQLKLYSQM